MFGPVSHVSSDCCQLYCVERTDLRTWERTILSYPPMPMDVAVRRARAYQDYFDPDFTRYDWRCGMCS